MPRAAGIVLTVIDDRRPVYAQLRVPHPLPDRPRYLNPTSDLATNSRIARARPVEERHAEVIVTEGSIDALSVAAAGYRAVAVLSATYGDEAVAVSLAKLPHPLIIAFAVDDAGRTGADHLVSLLEARQRPPVLLDLGSGDLNDALRHSDDWPRQMESAVGRALTTTAGSIGEAVSR